MVQYRDPHTFLDGEEFTAWIANQDLRDNLRYVRGLHYAGGCRTCDYSPGVNLGMVANSAHYIRVRGNGTISALALFCTAENGSVSVGVYSSKVVGNQTLPDALVAYSGVVKCPGADEPGIVALNTPVEVGGDSWFAIACNSAAAAFRACSSNTAANTLLANYVCQQSDVFPLPTLATGVAGGPVFMIEGVLV